MNSFYYNFLREIKELENVTIGFQRSYPCIYISIYYKNTYFKREDLIFVITRCKDTKRFTIVKEYDSQPFIYKPIGFTVYLKDLTMHDILVKYNDYINIIKKEVSSHNASMQAINLIFKQDKVKLLQLMKFV